MKKLIGVMMVVVFTGTAAMAQEVVAQVQNGSKQPLATPAIDSAPPIIDTTMKDKHKDTANIQGNNNMQPDAPGNTAVVPNVPATETKPSADNTVKKEAVADDRVMMKDGKMVIVKNGEQMSLDKDLTLNNGTVIKTDGTVKMASGKTMVLKDGQFISIKNKLGDKKSS